MVSTSPIWKRCGIHNFPHHFPRDFMFMQRIIVPESNKFQLFPYFACQTDGRMLMFKHDFEYCFWMIECIRVGFRKGVTDTRTDDLRMDRPSYRDAMPHLKTQQKQKKNLYRVGELSRIFSSYLVTWWNSFVMQQVWIPKTQCGRQGAARRKRVTDGGTDLQTYASKNDISDNGFWAFFTYCRSWSGSISTKFGVLTTYSVVSIVEYYRAL